MGARALNIVLGVWLFLSAFLWPHAASQRTNTWVLGLIIAIVAVASLKSAQASYLNLVASAWLFISAFALPHVSIATVWNNALVAIAVFLFALTPWSDVSPTPTQRFGTRAGEMG